MVDHNSYHYSTHDADSFTFRKAMDATSDETTCIQWYINAGFCNAKYFARNAALQ
jgi:hypothetical protein